MPGLITTGGGTTAPSTAPTAPSYGGQTIGGNLPFGALNGASGIDFSGNPAGLSASYANAYNSAVALNGANYSNILAGYQQTANNLGNAGQQISAGYGNLYNSVLGELTNAGQSAKQDTADRYAVAQGQMLNDLVNRGLGNTTVQSGVQRGLLYDREKSYNSIDEQVANMRAGYMSNLGMAGLQYQNQAAMQNAGQANQQLGWMNSVAAPYPDASAYGKLAEMYGAAQQAQANRDLQSQLAAQMRNRGGGGGGGGNQGYIPDGGGFMPPQSFGGGYFGGSIGYMPGAQQSAYSGGYSGGYSQPQSVLAWGGGGDWGSQDYTDPTGQWAGGPVGQDNSSLAWGGGGDWGGDSGGYGGGGDYSGGASADDGWLYYDE